MSASWQRILGLMITSSWLFVARPGRGKHRPLPAPSGLAHRGAAHGPCPRATVLAEPRPSPPLRHAPRRGRSVGGVCSRCSDRLLPAAPLANAERPPSALRRETRCQGLGFASGSSSLCLLGRASRPPIRSSPPHQTRPEALYFGYGPATWSWGESVAASPPASLLS